MFLSGLPVRGFSFEAFFQFFMFFCQCFSVKHFLLRQSLNRHAVRRIIDEGGHIERTFAPGGREMYSID